MLPVFPTFSRKHMKELKNESSKRQLFCYISFIPCKNRPKKSVLGNRICVVSLKSVYLCVNNINDEVRITNAKSSVGLVCMGVTGPSEAI